MASHRVERKTLWVFGLVFATLAIAMWLWFPWSEGAPVPVEGEIKGTHATASPLDGVLSGSEVPPDTDTRVAVVEEPAESSVAGQKSIGLLVVDGGSGAPVAEAEVWFATGTDAVVTRSFEDELRRDAELAADLQAYLQHHGRATRTDAEGRCSLPYAGTLRIAARYEDRYGELVCGGWTQIEQVLRMQADHPLTVSVLDAAGAPAAEIEIVGWIDCPDGTHTRRRLGETDVEGMWIRRHARTLIDPGEAAEIEVAAAPLGGMTASQRVDLAAPPEQPVVFRLPATGSLTLRVVDADGTPPTSARFWAYERRLQLLEIPGNGVEFGVWLDARASKRIGHVVLDRHFAAVQPRLRPPSFTFDGPTSDRPDVEAILRLDPGIVSAAGRAVDGDDHPLAQRLVMFNFEHEGVYVGSFAWTDESARFEALMIGIPAGSQPLLAMVLYSPTGILRENRVAIALDRPLVAGRNELGDVKFVPGALLGAGVIRLAGGGAPDRVQLRIENDAGGSWEYAQVQVHVAGDRFEIRGQLPPGQLRVVIQDWRYLQDAPVEFVAGATDIDVVLVACGAIPFVLAVDAATPWTDLDLRLTPTEDRAKLADEVRLEGEGRVRGRWAGVRPGRYRVEVRVAHRSEPLAVVDDVLVEPGGETIDPRLDPLDLRGLVRRVHLTVQTAGGELPDGLVAVVPDPLGESGCAYTPSADGRITIPVVDAIERIDVFARDCLPRVLRGVARDTDVVLDPAGPFVIVVDLGRSLPADLTATIALSAVPPNPIAGATSRGFHAIGGRTGGELKPHPQPVSGWHSTVLGAERRATFRLRSPGPYRLIVWLEAPNRSRAEVQVGSVASVDWQPGAPEFHCALTAAALREALTALGR